MDKGKAFHWILGILGIFLIVGGGLGAYVYGTFFKAAPLATLIIEQGTVQYGLGDSWKDASNGMTLKQDYSIKTMSGALAKIIFFFPRTLTMLFSKAFIPLISTGL